MQGMPVLVSLVEDNMADHGNLTQIGLQCIWRVLEVHGAGPLNHLCRLLANAGLPHRLMRAMLSLSQEHQVLLNKAEVHFCPSKLQCCHGCIHYSECSPTTSGFLDNRSANIWMHCFGCVLVQQPTCISAYMSSVS